MAYKIILEQNKNRIRTKKIYRKLYFKIKKTTMSHPMGSYNELMIRIIYKFYIFINSLFRNSRTKMYNSLG